MGDAHGKAVLRKKLERSRLLDVFVKLPPCLVGMEACGSAHYWARKLTALGHCVKPMAPQFVKPYVKTNKNDAADAEAICEAVTRPNMRFVPIKTDAQQAILSMHRVRQGFVKARTAQANRIRGLLAEFGLVISGTEASASASASAKVRIYGCNLSYLSSPILCLANCGRPYMLQ